MKEESESRSRVAKNLELRGYVHARANDQSTALKHVRQSGHLSNRRRNLGQRHASTWHPVASSREIDELTVNRFQRSSAIDPPACQANLKTSDRVTLSKMPLFLAYLLLALSCSVHTTISKNESNILRLGKPRENSSIPTHTPSSNLTDYEGEKEPPTERTPLIGFSKNNSELDWQKHQKMFEENQEERREELGVDFMSKKLEKTANSIQWLADLYDPLKWSRVPGKLEDGCRRDLELFLKSLKDGKLWAAKSK